jgi:hypothetical protein
LLGKPEKKVGCLGGQFLGIRKDMNFGLSSHINDDERGCRDRFWAEVDQPPSTSSQS